MLTHFTESFAPKPRSQSEQDDVFAEFETFAETTYINLVLANMQRALTVDEAAILVGAINTLSQGRCYAGSEKSYGRRILS